MIDVAGDLALNVGNDATLAGAQVQAGSADVAVAGDLTIASQTDTASAKSSSKGGSLSLGRSNSYGFSGQSSGPGSTSLGIGLNASQSDQDSVWVNGQSGIRTDGALDVTVGETTTLVGGLIGSDSGDLTLDTKSLTTSDIALKDNAMSAEGAVSLNISRVDAHKNAVGQTVAANTSTSGNVQGQYANREVEGIARATIGNGTVTIRDANGDGVDNTAADQAATAQQLAAINRDLDRGIEVTSVKEEGFEFYVSDSSVRAVAERFSPERLRAVREFFEDMEADLIAKFGSDYTDEDIEQYLNDCQDGTCFYGADLAPVAVGLGGTAAVVACTGPQALICAGGAAVIAGGGALIYWMFGTSFEPIVVYQDGANEGSGSAGAQGGATSASGSPGGGPDDDHPDPNKKPDDIPSHWVKTPSKKGGGTIYKNPNNPNDFVRVMPGNPLARYSTQRIPYVIRSRNGAIIDKNGNMVNPKSAEAHIPLRDFKF